MARIVRTSAKNAQASTMPGTAPQTFQYGRAFIVHLENHGAVLRPAGDRLIWAVLTCLNPDDFIGGRGRVVAIERFQRIFNAQLGLVARLERPDKV